MFLIRHLYSNIDLDPDVGMKRLLGFQSWTLSLLLPGDFYKCEIMGLKCYIMKRIASPEKSTLILIPGTLPL